MQQIAQRRVSLASARVLAVIRLPVSLRRTSRGGAPGHVLARQARRNQSPWMKASGVLPSEFAFACSICCDSCSVMVAN